MVQQAGDHKRPPPTPVHPISVLQESQAQGWGRHLQGLWEPHSHPSMLAVAQLPFHKQEIAWRDVWRATWEEKKLALELCKIVCHLEGLANGLPLF